MTFREKTFDPHARYTYDTGSIHAKLIRSVTRYAGLCQSEIVDLRAKLARTTAELETLKRKVDE